MIFCEMINSKEVWGHGGGEGLPHLSPEESTVWVRFITNLLLILNKDAGIICNHRLHKIFHTLLNTHIDSAEGRH
jgi:hypothetical protein